MEDIISFIGIGLIVGLAAGGAIAQVAVKQTPQEQAMSQKLLEEIGNNIALKAQVIQLQEELAKAKGDPPKEKGDAEHK